MADKMPNFSPVNLGGGSQDGVHDFRPKPVADSPKSAPEPVDSPSHPSEGAKKEPVKVAAKTGAKATVDPDHSALVSKTPPQRAKRQTGGKATSS